VVKVVWVIEKFKEIGQLVEELYNRVTRIESILLKNCICPACGAKLNHREIQAPDGTYDEYKCPECKAYYYNKRSGEVSQGE